MAGPKEVNLSGMGAKCKAVVAWTLVSPLEPSTNQQLLCYWYLPQV